MASRNEARVKNTFELSATQVLTSSTLLGTVTVDAPASYLSLTIDNNGGQTIDALYAVRYNHADDAGYTYMSGADWQDAANPNLVFSSSTANYQPADCDSGNEAQAVIRIDGAKKIALYAEAAAAQDTNGTVVRGMIY